jgi:hypothetical protein
VLVKLTLIQTYERMIFELQQEVLRYKVLVDQMLARAVAPNEEFPEPSISVTPGAVALLDSVLQASNEPYYRDFDQKE